MIVDGNETGPAYTSFEQMDYDVGQDDFILNSNLTYDVGPGTTASYDLRNMDDTVDAVNSTDENCFTIEEKEDEESDVELSPELIDSIFTDGPFEVFTTVELNTDENGEAVLTINPSKPGTYISIVRAKALSYQNTLTGLGAQFL